jgi:two-component system, response regulator
MLDQVILLVEDNTSDVLLTKRALEKNRISNELIIAEDGQAALDYLYCEGAHAQRNPDKLPMLILLDLKLPKVDGLEVLRRIRDEERTRRIPVVILTSSKEHEDLTKSYDLGVNSFVRKPVDFTQFVEAVKQLGLYWLVLNESPPLD